MIALSQSGRTPDVVEYVARARAGGALTLALTNDPGSELGQAAELQRRSRRPELAVAATKTYLNDALALLAGGAVGGAGRSRTASAASPPSSPTAPRPGVGRRPGRGGVRVRRTDVRDRPRPRVRNRAREIALKRTETCRVAAEPLTATDLVHGPLAALDPLFPVCAIASPDESLRAVVEAAARARMAGAAIIASGSRARDRGLLVSPAGAGRGRPDLCAALSVVPGQLFAAALAREGPRADSPRSG